MLTEDRENRTWGRGLNRSVNNADGPVANVFVGGKPCPDPELGKDFERVITERHLRYRCLNIQPANAHCSSQRYSKRKQLGHIICRLARQPERRARR